MRLLGNLPYGCESAAYALPRYFQALEKIILRRLFSEALHRFFGSGLELRLGFPTFRIQQLVIISAPSETPSAPLPAKAIHPLS